MNDKKLTPIMGIAIIFLAVLMLSFIGPMYAAAGIHPFVPLVLFLGLIIYVIRHTRRPGNPENRDGPPPAI